MENQALCPGTMLAAGRYKIMERLAAGGFGMVYAAQDTRSGARVAVKELFWRDRCHRDEGGAVCLTDEKDTDLYANVQSSFRREAEILERLAHVPGIVHSRETFEENGTAYIVMDDVPGVTLAHQNRARAKDARPDAAALMRSFLPLMESLALVHDAGIIHRDVSPENIIVSPKGGMTLIDFGSAGTYEREEDERFTTIAKDGFAPEEQYREDGKQGPYSDVYGLCATIYACLTGIVPDSARARRIMDELKAPSQLGIRIAPEMEAALMRGLAVDRTRRFADMRSLAAAVRRALKAGRLRVIRSCAAALMLAAVIGFAGVKVTSLFADDAAAPGNLIQAVWENPMNVDTEGKNQVRAAELKGETTVYLYDFYELESATQGEREDLMRMLKLRIDALGVPYAFSAQTGDPRYVAVRLSPERMSSFILGSLAGNYLYVTGEHVEDDVMISYNRYDGASILTVEDRADGSYVLRCEIGKWYSFDTFMEAIQARGDDTLYLRDGNGNALAQAPLSKLKDGVIEFTALRFEGAQAMDESTRFVADYIDQLVNQPPLPLTGTHYGTEALDSEGNRRKEEGVKTGMQLPRTKSDQALIDVLRAIHQDTGYPCYENTDGLLFVSMDLPVDDSLPERVAQEVERLLGGYPLAQQVYNHSVILQLIDEEDDERCRVAMGKRISFDDSPGEENGINGFLAASERLKPYEEALDAWWQSLPDVYHGFSVAK